MEQSSRKEGEGHDEGSHRQHHFSYNQQQPASAGLSTYHSIPSSSSRDALDLSSSHSESHTRDWFPVQPSVEDNTIFRSSYNFMDGNEDEHEVRRRLEHQQQSISSYYNSHSSQHSQTLASIEQHIEKEHMFDKVVTPSDVGKLNRLVIPKQHAERYFPLDSSANEKGLLLNFEDRTHKLWRFRYSYWNSSQSYVMTKGWNRFVKEKKLDAGDIVSFQRGVGDAFRDRFFIDWRRRPSNPLIFYHEPSLIIPSLSLPRQYFPFHQGSRSAPWVASTITPLYLRPVAQLTSGHHFPQHKYINYHSHPHSHHYNQYHQRQLQQGVRGNFQCRQLYNNNNIVSYPYGGEAVGSSPQTVVYLKSFADESLRGDGIMNPMVLDSIPAVHPLKADGKKLRLFGVNMECDKVANNHDEPQNLSSSPIPVKVSSPSDSSQYQNDEDTSDHNGRSQGNMSLNLSVI